ncbi:MAG TPA: YqgE/AlgH family protein, partial [Thermoanaerobaculia bacterium]|nr:YqgE/AlgH family protein [Thermoanaerobaculia bacterium]
DAGAFFGGPVQPQLGSVLFVQGREGVSEGALERLSAATEVAPGLAVTHHVGDLRVLAEAPPDRMRLFLGYAGWGAGQLVEEILRDDWLLAPVQEDLVFAPDPDEVWEKAVRSVGVDPATLPSWSAGGGDQEAN